MVGFLSFSDVHLKEQESNSLLEADLNVLKPSGSGFLAAPFAWHDGKILIVPEIPSYELLDKHTSDRFSSRNTIFHP